MDVRLIQFTFFTLKVSVILEKEKKYNITHPYLKYGHNSLIFIDEGKNRKIETVSSLIGKYIEHRKYYKYYKYYANIIPNNHVYTHYGIFASLNQDNIIESIIDTLKKRYKSIKIHTQKPKFLVNKNYIVDTSISDIIESFTKNNRDVDFYSVL